MQTLGLADTAKSDSTDSLGCVTQAPPKNSDELGQCRGHTRDPGSRSQASRFMNADAVIGA